MASFSAGKSIGLFLADSLCCVEPDARQLPFTEARVLVIALLRFQRAQWLRHGHLRFPIHSAEDSEQMTDGEGFLSAMLLQPRARYKELVRFRVGVLLRAIFL